MKYRIMTIYALLAVVVLPVSAFAATYGYINVNGGFETENADNATLALSLPVDRASHSGVILLSANSQVSSTITSVVIPPTTMIGPMVVTPIVIDQSSTTMSASSTMNMNTASSSMMSASTTTH